MAPRRLSTKCPSNLCHSVVKAPQSSFVPFVVHPFPLRLFKVRVQISLPLRQNLLDHLPMHIGQAKIPPRVAIGQLFMIEA